MGRWGGTLILNVIYQASNQSKTVKYIDQLNCISERVLRLNIGRLIADWHRACTEQVQNKCRVLHRASAEHAQNKCRVCTEQAHLRVCTEQAESMHRASGEYAQSKHRVCTEQAPLNTSNNKVTFR